MTSEKQLRQIIREALSNIENKVRMTNEEDCIYSKKCTWELFEEFGLRILQAMDYSGDYGIIDRVKEDLKAEGWDYDEI